uniref:MAP7 domain-containing protein 2-like n=1 Tax=Poecilia formosa TaxID=48698 RepID=A0A096MDI2_POEFO
MKTDDRMRLARFNLEHRETGATAREQLIREKERRARLQYERTVEERWRRLEEQRQKEELRRAAVEEKRRQQLEEERERLEALMKRSLERSLQLEQRTKRWGRGYPPGAGTEVQVTVRMSHSLSLLPPPFPMALPPPILPSADLVKLSPPTHNLPNASSPCSSNGYSVCVTMFVSRLKQEYKYANSSCVAGGFGYVSKFCVKIVAKGTEWMTYTVKCEGGYFISSINPGFLPGCQISIRVYKERLRRDRRTASPVCGSPVRRSESPASVTRQLTSPSASRLASKTRTQSPGSSSQYHRSPTRCHPNQNDDRKGEDKKLEKKGEQPKAESAARTSAETKNLNSSSQGQFVRNLNREAAANTSTGKVGAGTTNAEEATRLLAERRRQARAQKELEEKKQENEQEGRMREEEQKKQLAQQQQGQQAKAQQEEVRRNNVMDHHRLKLEEDKRKEEQQQVQIEAEKEKAKVQAKEDAERQRQGREQQTQQEEEERQLRKKRIEEIMKRTRKSEADIMCKKESNNQKQPTAQKPPLLKTVHSNTLHMNIQGEKSDILNEMVFLLATHASKKVEFQVKEEIMVQVETKESVTLKIIKLEPLDVKRTESCDGVQSMDVSPASKEELISIPEYSPNNEIEQGFMSHNQALKDLMDLTGSVTHTKLPSESTIGDCNKNLIRGVVSPMTDSKLIGVAPPSSNKLSV